MHPRTFNIIFAEQYQMSSMIVRTNTIYILSLSITCISLYGTAQQFRKMREVVNVLARRRSGVVSNPILSKCFSRFIITGCRELEPQRASSERVCTRCILCMITACHHVGFCLLRRWLTPSQNQHVFNSTLALDICMCWSLWSATIKVYVRSFLLLRKAIVP